MASFGCAGSYKARLRSRCWLCERKELNEADDHVVGRRGTVRGSRVAGRGSQIAVASHSRAGSELLLVLSSLDTVMSLGR